MNQPTAATSIACDMTTAADTGPERFLEYERLFTQALVGRERTAEGIRFRLRADEGVEVWVRDIAAREKACCAFYDFQITTDGHEVLWDASVIDDDIARDILDEFYGLPDNIATGLDGFENRLTQRGLRMSANTAGTITEVRRAESAASRLPGPSPDRSARHLASTPEQGQEPRLSAK